MKTLKQFAAALLLICCTLAANAQCNINGGWKYTINPNLVHVFTDTSTVSAGYQITTRYWTFGDGSTTTQANPSHYYSTPGNYTVCEYIIATEIGGSNTCRDTVCQLVSNCNGVVQAATSATVQGSIVVYTGTGTSNYPPLNYSWTFAGGSPSTSNTAVTTVQYNAPGVHTACLTVRDTNGCSATVCRDDTTTTTPCGNLVANFNASINSGYVYLSSTSTGTTTNTLYQWWRDGQAITNPNPNTAYYNYSTAGIHTYCLYVYSAQNSFCDSACRTYTIDTCNANFQTSINNNVVTFTPQRTGNGNGNYWSFGDGTSGGDTSSSFIHTYPSFPNTTTYEVCHVWGQGNCVDTVCKLIVIPGTTTCGNASFTSSQSSGSLVLTSTSSGSNLNAVWTVRNSLGNTVLTGSGTPFTASPLSAGTYQVCLALYTSNQQFCDSTCQTVVVTNSTGCGNLNAVLTYTVRNNWLFIDGNSTGTTSLSLFRWVLNGVAGPLNNDDHFGVIPVPTGTNTLCLMAYSGPTLCDSACATFVVDSCPASAGPFQYTAQNNLVTFFPLSAGGTLNNWTFGDGTSTSNTSSQLTHTYPTNTTSRTYTVLLVRIAGTCYDSIWQQIVVPASATCGNASFTSSQSSGSLVLTSTSTGSNTNVVWAIRNPNGVGVLTGSGTPFTAATLPNGTYQVCLYLYNNNQQLCDTTCQTIALVQPVTTCITLQPDSAGKDAILASIDPAVNYGNHVNFFSDAWTHNGVRIEDRSLLQFNLSSIPTSSTIVSARLSLYADTSTIAGYAGQPTYGSNNASYLQRVIAPWVENTVTWNSQPAATVDGQVTLATSTNTRQDYPNIDVAGFAQQWVNLPTQNYGMLLDMLSTTPYNLMAFGSSDHPNPAKRPRLEICYTPCNAIATITRYYSGNGTAGLVVTSAGLTPVSYAWSTGATSQSITVSNNGNYCVTVTGAGGCSAVTCYNYTFSPCGYATFTSTQSNGQLTLTGTDTASGLSRKWYVSDANYNLVANGTTNPFTVSSLPAGTYNACLSVSSGNYYCDSACQTVTVTNANPCAGLTAQWTQTYNANNSVTFAAANTISGATYAWNFGDGQTSTLANPTHGYLNAGLFNVCLIVRLPGSVCADTICRNIQANPVNTCNATASIAATNNGNGSKTLTATATGLGTSLTYAWSVGATTQAITVTAPGQYCVTITGNNICSATACYSFTPTPCGTASFTATQSSGHIVLTSTSTGTNNQYVWAIRTQNGTGVATGSGSPFTSPVLANGVYQVCLYLYSSNQTLCDTTCQYVTVNTSNPCLGVSAQWTKTYNTNNSISFTASNQASGNTYLWTFGDGTSATTADPVHGYTTAGLYNVCLIVRRTGTFCADTVCQNLQANPANTCTAVASFTTTIVNGSILATSTSTNLNSNSHYYWNVYGSNNNLIQSQSGTNTSFQSQVLPAGTYQVCLYLFGSNTQTFCDSACTTVTIVNANPCAGLNADYTYAYLTSGGVQFYPVTNAGTTTHYWNFGDGTTSTNADPIHYYTTAGLYTICHAVQIPGTNCFDSTCTTIQVTAGNPCSGFGVQVNVTSGWFTARHLEPVVAGGTAPYTYLWSNGATTRAIYPTTTGNYCVTVYDANQCSATDCETFTSNTPPCNASYSYTRVNCSTIQFTNTSTGGYTNVVWNFGDGTSSSATNPTHSFGVGTWTVQLTVYSNGSNCQASYYQVITIQPCGINDTICGVVFNDINGNGVQESSEPGIGGGTIYAGNYQVTVSSNGHYTLVLPAGNYTLYYCAAPGNSFTIPVGTQNPNSNTSTCAYYTITTSGGSHCGYNFGVQNNSSTVCGVVYFDANNNQVQDAGETGQANAHVIITRSNGTVVHSYADQSGHYCVTLFPGTYTLTVQTPSGFTLTPQAITLTTVAGTNYYNNNFGLYTQPGSCNLRLDIVPHTTITAGFAAWYDLIVTNLGASTSDGTVSMFFDPALTFTSASPAQTSANNSTHTVSWDFTGITPGGTRRFLANFRALTNIQINQPVFTLANVTSTNCNEVNFTDNIDTVHQNVTASWDPNNKLVVPDGIIKGDERLTYTVNFQNTGTAPAVNVVLRDMIAPELDIETFEMVGASHPYSLQFAGREAIWKFTAIMLPDSNSNEPQSHGHVTFSILPKANLNKGTQITNTADIYFDYNAPVGTNSTLNTIDYELSVADLENGKVAITLMPNPFKEFTTIKIDGENTAYELKMFDMLGQQIYQDRTTNNLFSIQRQTLAAGVYMYQITKQGKVIGQGKMIAE